MLFFVIEALYQPNQKLYCLSTTCVARDLMFENRFANSNGSICRPLKLGEIQYKEQGNILRLFLVLHKILSQMLKISQTCFWLMYLTLIKSLNTFTHLNITCLHTWVWPKGFTTFVEGRRHQLLIITRALKQAGLGLHEINIKFLNN